MLTIKMSYMDFTEMPHCLRVLVTDRTGKDHTGRFVFDSPDEMYEAAMKYYEARLKDPQKIYEFHMAFGKEYQRTNIRGMRVMSNMRADDKRPPPKENMFY